VSAYFEVVMESTMSVKGYYSAATALYTDASGGDVFPRFKSMNDSHGYAES
jgi:hypothetical protein